MSLEGGHFHTEDALALRGERGQHVALETPQHEGLELLVQLLDLHFMICVGQVELVGQLD